MCIPVTKSKSLLDTYWKGVKAAKEGVSKSDCPYRPLDRYSPGAKYRIYWFHGYNDALEEAQNAQGR